MKTYQAQIAGSASDGTKNKPYCDQIPPLNSGWHLLTLLNEPETNMTILAKDNGGRDYKPIPQGTHIAICNAVVDCGVQPGGRFKPQHKIYIRFEVPAERVEFEKDGVKQEGPMQIGKFYTLSLSEKANLRKDLVAWRGRQFTAEELAGFDVSKLLGVPCQITVAHETGADQKTYANIIAVMGLPKGMAKPKAERPLLLYSPEDKASFDQLPKWLQEKVSVSSERVEEVGARFAKDEDFDDDIPF